MNVLFLEGDMSRRGGTERMTAILSGYFAINQKVHIISLRQAGKSVFYHLNKNVQYTVLSKTGMINQIFEIRKYIRQNSIEIVINVDVGMGIYGIVASTGMKTKVITWEHANYYNNWGSKNFPKLRRIAARYSDAMVVLTEKDKKNYLDNIRRCVSITVIPNPSESQKFQYDVGPKMILSAGLFSEIKRFDLIPEIAVKIFQMHPDWKWVICGDGPEYENVQSKIQNYNLTDKIILCGSVSDMSKFYQSAAMYVMTSRMEGLPMVLLEAKAFGLPLVSFDIMTGPSDIIRNGVNGYLIPDGNLQEMTTRIIDLMDNSGLRRQFSNNAKLDMDKFSTESVVEKWEKLIRSL